MAWVRQRKHPAQSWALAAVLLAAQGWSASAVAQQCSFDTLSSIAFGVYSPLTAAPNDSMGSLAVRCAPRSALTLELSPGSSGSFALRTLRQGVNALGYNLYREAARVSVWGDGTGGSQVVVVPDSGPPGNPTNVFMYGRIPGGQWVAAGGYADTVVLTVVF